MWMPLRLQVLNISPTSQVERIKWSHQTILRTSKPHPHPHPHPPEQTWPRARHTKSGRNGEGKKKKGPSSRIWHRRLPTSKTGTCCPRSLLTGKNPNTPLVNEGKRKRENTVDLPSGGCTGVKWGGLSGRDKKRKRGFFFSFGEIQGHPRSRGQIIEFWKKKGGTLGTGLDFLSHTF